MDHEREYVIQMRPLLNKNALFSDETEMFLSPMEPEEGDTVTIRFRTYRNNVDAVYLLHEDMRIRMEYQENKEGFDYYATSIHVGSETFSYIFQIVLGNTVCYYSKVGVSHEPDKGHLFRIIPGFHTPDWAKGAVMYQIFVDRFRNGDPDNDVESDEYSYITDHVRQVENWYQLPQEMDVRNFYGGDLAGVIEKMDYLQDLGVECIYLNPVFVSPSNHKYDIQDYDYIDPHFGKIVRQEEGLLSEWDHDNRHAAKYISRVTDRENLEAGNRLFAQLVQEAHRRGIKVILDGVFNHCGSFNKWMDREQIYEDQPGYEPGAYVAEDSPYHDFFQFSDGHGWPYNENYDGWWGHNTLPKLNYENSEKLQQEVFRIARKWVSEPFCADGWRLDVAADLGHSPEFNHSFWKEFRKNVKEANPKAVILAEHYGDPSSWLGGDEWDTVMNYDAFMEPVSWFLTGMEKHSDAYREDLLGNSGCCVDTMRYHMANFTAPSLLTAMNELDNHDHSRFLTRTNHRVGRIQTAGTHAAEEGIHKAVMREAVVMQMTWPGAPTVYYGDEAGVCGFTDPDNRRTYPWGTADRSMIRFYRSIIALHKQYKILSTGSVIFLLQEQDVLAYARFDQKEQIVVILNNRKEQAALDVQVWPAGISRVKDRDEMIRIFTSDQEGYSEEKEGLLVSGGQIHIVMEAESSTVLWHRNSESTQEEQ